MKCYLCKNQNISVIRRRLRNNIKRDVLKCLKCGLVFLRPKKKNLRDFYRAEYRRQYSSVLKKAASPDRIFKTYSPFQKLRLGDIRSILKPHHRLLDIGCSSGAFLSEVKEYVRECVGNEFNERDATFVRRKLGIRVYTEPLENTDLAPRSFDVITAFQVLEHVDDPVRFLNIARRYLKPGGYLVIEVPNVSESLLTLFDVSPYEDFYYREVHEFYYSPETLLALLKKAGFRGTVRGASYAPNFINQLNWILAKAPQADAASVYGAPLLPWRKGVDLGEKKILENWFSKKSGEYRAFLKRNLLSESILFSGRTSKHH